MNKKVKISLIIALLLNTSIMIIIDLTKSSSTNDGWVMLVKYVYVVILLVSVYFMLKKQNLN
jgi:hypothetical protein